MYLLRIFPVLLLLSACANPVAPTGGPKDTTPPRIRYAQPDTFATNVNDKTFYMRFDEWVVLQNAQREVLISPPPPSFPDIKLKGKGVLVEFKDSLLPNTTYQINFGSSIADFTEGNVAKGMRLVFSTGAYLDSGSVKFKITDAFTLEPIQGVACMLYNAFDDSLPLKQRPDYVSFTDANGEAVADYIRSGNYKVFALKEMAIDYLYNSPVERIAFLPDTIASDSARQLTMRLFQEIPDSNTVRRPRDQYPGKSYMTFLMPVDSLTLTFSPDSLSKHWRWEWGNQRKDSLVIWYGNYIPDSIALYIDWQGRLDTILQRPTPRRKLPPGRSGKGRAEDGPDLFRMEKFPPVFPHHSPVKFEFNHPVEKIFPERIKTYLDTNLISMSFTIRGVTGRFIEVDSLPSLGVAYSIVFADSSMKDIFGNYLPKDSVSFRVDEKADYQQVWMLIRNTDSIQSGVPVLMEWKEGDILSLHAPDSIFPARDTLPPALGFFRRLKPGKYTFRLLFDGNDNGKWDTGNYLKGIQPERMVQPESGFEVRKGFDLERAWDLNPPPPVKKGADKAGVEESPPEEIKQD
jgi:hypothetical protein